MREHLEATGAVDFVPMHEEIVTSYLEGTTQEVTLHDGSVVRLQKTGSDHDPRDRNAALGADESIARR